MSRGVSSSNFFSIHYRNAHLSDQQNSFNYRKKYKKWNEKKIEHDTKGAYSLTQYLGASFWFNQLRFF